MQNYTQKGFSGNPKMIIYAPIGEERGDKLTHAAERDARTKREIIKALVRESRNATVLYNSNHGPSCRAAEIMTGSLTNVKRVGLYNSNFSSKGAYNKDIILDCFEEHKHVSMLIIVASTPVCHQMPNHYSGAHNQDTFDMRMLHPDEVYTHNLREKTLHISYVQAQ